MCIDYPLNRKFEWQLLLIDVSLTWLYHNHTIDSNEVTHEEAHEAVDDLVRLIEVYGCVGHSLHIELMESD